VSSADGFPRCPRHPSWWCYNLVVTIHGDYPFPAGERNPVRQFRGRMAAPVSIWTCMAQTRNIGWTVSSFLVADGSPGMVVGLLDEDSDLAAALRPGAAVAVSLLGWQHRSLADAFAQVTPAPGGAFRQGEWSQTDWGPVLADAPGWLGARLTTDPKDHAGWTLLVRADIEHSETGPEAPVLARYRGRYHPFPPQP
jgi:flavin reductase (DIM6/NTAB) family NADH-FMN oxidoreductase RutF